MLLETSKARLTLLRARLGMSDEHLIDAALILLERDVHEADSGRPVVVHARQKQDGTPDLDKSTTYSPTTVLEWLRPWMGKR